MSCKATCCSIVIPIIQTSDRPEHVAAARVPSPFAWVLTLVRWQERWRQRQCLRDLDDHLLEDIGLTREQALDEARKSFWM
jgi:uncharacterized protein YjiS (DUF1127 family)